jgi:molecular chaperone GrpE
MTKEPEDDAMDETDLLELDLEEERVDPADEAQAEEATVEGAAAERERGESQGELARLQQELEDLRNRSVRTLADYENYRKRVQREREQERRFAGFQLLQEFVEVVDNLERALAAEASAESLKVGVEMILKQMQEILQRAGVRRIAALGEPFDHDVHEAVGRREEAGVNEPTVEEEHQAGYTMHDRLLRPARVTVAMPVSEADDDARAADAADEETQ